MSLRTERRDGGEERQVLIGMIASRAVLGPIAARWEPGLFPSRAGNLIGSWCVEHYGRYNRAPGREIATYLDRWAGTADRDPETISAVESLLAGLSDEFERMRQDISPQFVIDAAARLFNRHRLVELRRLIDADVAAGDVERAETRVGQFRKVEIGAGAGINVLTADEEFESAFDQRADVLVQYPGAAGNFFGKALAREGFVAFLGKPKVGKSRWLFDVAWRGLEQKRNVAYFEMGDMTKAQLLTQRISTRVCRMPLAAGRYEYPTRLEPGNDHLPNLETDVRHAETGITPEHERLERRRFGRLVGDQRFKLSCHPAGTLTVPAAEQILETWMRDDWTPDIVCFDYADLAASTDRRADPLDQTNDTWIKLRALSQRLHCLVVTATQCNRAGFDVRTLRREHVGGDNRKLAHVTLMVGVNQTAQEHELGLYRLNAVAGRELDFGESRCLWTASCLAINDPCVHSTF